MNEDFSDKAPGMTIIVNGQQWTVSSECTVGSFLQERAIAPTRVVAQLDGVIIAREDFARTKLHQGCRLEIVTLVGGG